MSYKFLNYLKGIYICTADGRFPERLLNIASSNGIYIENVTRDKNGCLKFTISKKGYDYLATLIPNDIVVEITSKAGLPFFIKRYKKRIALFTLPLSLLIAANIYSRFLWKINLYGGSEESRSEVMEIIKDKGVYIGAQKNKIDPYEVKRTVLLESDNLSWLWVDIHGTTANIEIRERDKKPVTEKNSEPANVIASHDGVIEEMQIFCGAPLVNIGETVEKGQTLISGIITTDNENIPPYYHHASGIITARIWKEKTEKIPKYNIKKTPTGKEKNTYSIKFKKNNINFSFNSGISYSKYDKIVNKVKIPLLPLTLIRTKYCEITTSQVEADTNKEISLLLEKFSREIKNEGAEIVKLSHTVNDKGDYLDITITAECLARIDKEIPIEKNDIIQEEN